jgi:hypothetical protein
MSRRAGQLISRGPRTWLVRISLGREPEIGTRKYHNITIHGFFREAQNYLNIKLQERHNGRLPLAAAISLNQYLDQWLVTSANPRSWTKPSRRKLLMLNLALTWLARNQDSSRPYPYVTGKGGLWIIDCGPCRNNYLDETGMLVPNFPTSMSGTTFRAMVGRELQSARMGWSGIRIRGSPKKLWIPTLTRK